MLEEFISNFKEDVKEKKERQKVLKKDLEFIKKQIVEIKMNIHNYRNQYNRINNIIKRKFGEETPKFSFLDRKLLKVQEFEEYQQLTKQKNHFSDLAFKLTEEKYVLEEKIDNINSELSKMSEENLEFKTTILNDERKIVEYVLKTAQPYRHYKKFMTEVVRRYPDLIKYFEMDSPEPYKIVLEKMIEDMQSDPDNVTKEQKDLIVHIKDLLHQIDSRTEHGGRADSNHHVSLKYAFEAIREGMFLNEIYGASNWYDVSSKLVKKYVMLDKRAKADFVKEMERMYENPTKVMAIYGIDLRGDNSNNTQTLQEIMKDGIKVSSGSKALQDEKPPRAENILKIAHHNHCIFLDMLDYEYPLQYGYVVLQIVEGGIKPGAPAEIWGSDSIEKTGDNREYYLLPGNIAGFIYTANHQLKIENRHLIKRDTRVQPRKFRYYIHDYTNRYGEFIYTERHIKTNPGESEI